MFGWLGLLLTVFGLYLNGRKIIWCFPVWIASNVAWCVSGVPIQVILMNCCMFGLNLAGWRNWARPATPGRSFAIVRGEDARRMIAASMNPPAPTQELIDLMRMR